MHLIFIYMFILLLSWLTLALATNHTTNSTNSTNVTCTDGLCTNGTCAYGYYNTTGNGCTNVTCTAGLCSNNTCEYGFYNTTVECVPCDLLKQQYKTEKCCSIYTTSSPYRAIPIENKIYENDTGTVQVVSTPPRPICHHLWTEYGLCPEVCENLLIGEICTINYDCKDSKSCKNFCCAVEDINCLSCANQTGYCNLCKDGLGFNATGDLKCKTCPSWTFLSNNTCHLVSNCTAGTYVIRDVNYTQDRQCDEVPYGSFTNETNQHQPFNWTVCYNNTFALGGNSTHDSVCVNKTDCTAGSFVVENLENKDRVCEECVNSFSNTTNQLVCYDYTNCSNNNITQNGTNETDVVCG